jgi:hypothetical protein
MPNVKISKPVFDLVLLKKSDETSWSVFIEDLVKKVETYERNYGLLLKSDNQMSAFSENFQAVQDTIFDEMDSTPLSSRSLSKEFTRHLRKDMHDQGIPDSHQSEILEGIQIDRL